MKFPTHAVLSASTGKLMGDIGGLYSVISFLIGRDAFTHELAFYGEKAGAVICDAVPSLPNVGAASHVTRDNATDVLAGWVSEHGDEIDLPDSLRGCLADGQNAITTLGAMLDSKATA